MINRFLATAPIATSLGYLSTLSCPKTLHNIQQRDRRQQKKSACMCVAFLIYWPTDLLMCVRPHAARSTSLEHPGLASLGAHALKLLTFPNLFPSLLIVVKNWTQPPSSRSCVVNLDLTSFLLRLSVICPHRCLTVKCKKKQQKKTAYICPGPKK